MFASDIFKIEHVVKTFLGLNMNIRRVVTGHNTSGQAVVRMDEIYSNVISRRAAHKSCVIWSTGQSPADNSSEEDGGYRQVQTVDPAGSVFRVVEYSPGVAPRNHRTESIDYAVVMSGAIDMVLDEETVHLKAGDVLVQRGTIHNWVNPYEEPCVIAFVLLAAKPLELGSKVLQALG